MLIPTVAAILLGLGFILTPEKHEIGSLGNSQIKRYLENTNRAPYLFIGFMLSPFIIMSCLLYLLFTLLAVPANLAAFQGLLQFRLGLLESVLGLGAPLILAGKLSAQLRITLRGWKHYCANLKENRGSVE